MKLSVHMLVLNAASVIERALRSVAPAADEICIVDTGSSDGTPDLVKYLCQDVGLTGSERCRQGFVGVQIIRLHPDTHPWLYFKDEPSSWKRTIPGPFTGLPILRDWAYARNLGVEMCRGDWILKLDADDECLDPGGLAMAVRQLSVHPSIDYLVCPYEVMGTGGVEMVTFQDRIWRNKPSIRFYLPLHERLSGRGTLPNGQANWLITAAGLRFRDWRDSTGSGVRVAHRNFKVLLAEQERLAAGGEQLDPTSLYDLGCEAIHADPGFALDILGQVPGAISSCPGREGAWHEMESQWNKDMARAHLACGNKEQARLSYHASIEIYPRQVASWLGLGLLELEVGLGSWRETLKTAIKLADETARFNVFLPDLMEARKLLETEA